MRILYLFLLASTMALGQQSESVNWECRDSSGKIVPCGVVGETYYTEFNLLDPPALVLLRPPEFDDQAPPATSKAPTEKQKGKPCQYGQPGCPQRPGPPLGPTPQLVPPYLAPQAPQQGPNASTFAKQKPPKPQPPLVPPVWQPQPKMDCGKIKNLSSSSMFRCGASGKMEVLVCADSTYRFIYTSEHKPMCMAPPPKMPHDAQNPDLSYPYGLAKKPPPTK